MLRGALYRSELAWEPRTVGYRTEKAHVVKAFSTRHAETEAVMAERDLGDSAASPRFAERAALMIRSHRCDIDKQALCENRLKQVADPGFDAQSLAVSAVAEGGRRGPRRVSLRRFR